MKHIRQFIRTHAYMRLLIITCMASYALPAYSAACPGRLAGLDALAFAAIAPRPLRLEATGSASLAHFLANQATPAQATPDAELTAAAAAQAEGTPQRKRTVSERYPDASLASAQPAPKRAKGLSGKPNPPAAQKQHKKTRTANGILRETLTPAQRVAVQDLIGEHCKTYKDQEWTPCLFRCGYHTGLPHPARPCRVKDHCARIHLKELKNIPDADIPHLQAAEAAQKTAQKQPEAPADYSAEEYLEWLNN